ncbi:hypothetical protein [Mycobacterium lepromatosis]|uniref:hypothetical protein n=1 Tax=Mycobacterium lepromatosis TaxID=480418 RepID=UPI0012DFF316|nr:hypothetical protein [Mycobacterium lepromatosis]
MTDLGSGDAPLPLLFVVSAAAELTESDCALLDTAVDNTEVVSTIDCAPDLAQRGYR